VDTVAKPGVDGFKHIECTVCHLTLKTELIPALPVVADPDVTTKEPDVTTKEPEATEPEATEPEATEPEATESEATESEATESEATESEATESEATELEATEKEPEITKPEAKPPEEKSSCNSTVSGALAIVALTTAAGALCLVRKKED
jgi:cobalamin biosynthesis Mg chelatase CobN